MKTSPILVQTVADRLNAAIGVDPRGLDAKRLQWIIGSRCRYLELPDVSAYAAYLEAVSYTHLGISAWMPSFLQRSGFSPDTVGITLGGLTAGAGLGGTAAGGWLAQRWLRTNRRALYLVSAWSALLTVPFGVVCFFGPRVTMLPSLGIAMFCIFLGTGPLNAAIVNAVPAAVRATAIAIELFLIHALGDTPSPTLIGMVSDHSTLATGLGLTLVTMLIATVLLFLGAQSASKHEEVTAALLHS